MLIPTVHSSQLQRNARSLNTTAQSARRQKRSSPILNNSFAKTAQPKMNLEQLDNDFNSSINVLRDNTRSARSLSATLSNRLSYMQVDLRRKRQMIDIAKNKYQRMIHVRHQSFVEKTTLNQERQEFIKKHYQTVSSKAGKIRQERGKSAISSKLWRERNQQAAMKLKDRRFRNQKIIMERQEIEVQKNREKVKQSHQCVDLSRSRLNRMKNGRLQEGKQHHQRKLLQEYLKGEMQRRKNTKLAVDYEMKAKEAGMTRLQFQNELWQYQRNLGLKVSGNSVRRENN